MFNKNKMAAGSQKVNKKILVRVLVFAFTFGIPLLLVLTSIYIFHQTKTTRELPAGEAVESEAELVPSLVLANKAKYNQKRITIRGKAEPESVVCQRLECPKEDPCCGCPQKRDLFIFDPGLSLSTGERVRIRLLAESGESFCQRIQSSCDYDCRDWVRGAIYDVWGTFSSEAPPSGWKLSLGNYFQVEGKRLVKRISLLETASNFLNAIKEKIQGLRTSGQYILP